MWRVRSAVPFRAMNRRSVRKESDEASRFQRQRHAFPRRSLGRTRRAIDEIAGHHAGQRRRAIRIDVCGAIDRFGRLAFLAVQDRGLSRSDWSGFASFGGVLRRRFRSQLGTTEPVLPGSPGCRRRGNFVLRCHRDSRCACGASRSRSAPIGIASRRRLDGACNWCHVGLTRSTLVATK